MNNKNIIGLFVYIAIMMVVIILPSLCANSFFYSLSCGQNTSCTMSLLENVLLGLGFFFTPILYLLLPILVTILAIKYHWSCYLDNFFNQFKYPTFIFIMVLFIIFIYKHFDLLDGNHSILLWDFYYAVVPPYCLIYLVILMHNIRKKYPNQCKK